MNKSLLLLFSLSLIACASQPIKTSTSKAEQLLSRGIKYYSNDYYPAAEQNFKQALQLYQSVDDYKGTELARINLTEALLALNKFYLAEEQLVFLSGTTKNTERTTLLRVKLLFQKQQYKQALAVIEPLMVNAGTQDKYQQLELLATAARLEALVSTKKQQPWLIKFQAALSQVEGDSSKFKVVLKRIFAIAATQNQQYQQALNLLNEALAYYKKNRKRRAIAGCLSDMAGVELKRNDAIQALKYLQRALAIRIWLQDQYHIDVIRKQWCRIQPDAAMLLNSPIIGEFINCD